MKVEERERSRPSARNQPDFAVQVIFRTRTHLAAGRLFPPFLESISYGALRKNMKDNARRRGTRARGGF